MRRSLWAVAVCVTMVGCGGQRKAPETPSSEFEFTGEVEAFEAEAGYAVIVLPEPSTSVVNIHVRYPAGSATDPKGKEGLAHLVEHLLFEIDIAFGSGKTLLNNALAEISLANNATTTHDYMQFDASATPDKLSALLHLEVERARATCDEISDAVFAREREVVTNELRQRLGTGGADLIAQVYRALYGAEHPYGRMGSVESVSALTKEDVCAFMENQLQSGEATFIISGNISSDTVRRLFSQQGPRLPQRQRDKRTAIPPPAPAKKRVKITADVGEALYLAAWPGSRKGTAHFRTFRNAHENIGRIVDNHAWYYEWGTGASSHLLGGHWSPYFVTAVAAYDASDLDDAGEAVEIGTARIQRKSWLRKAVWGHSLSRRVLAWENLYSRAQVYADSVTFGTRPLFRALSSAEIKAQQVESKAAHKDLKKMLDFDRAVIIEILPRKNSTGKLDVEQAIAGVHRVHSGLEVDTAEADGPLSIPEDTGLLLQTVRSTVANGLRFILWPHGEIPTVHSRLVVGSGYAHAKKGEEGIARFAGFDDIHEEAMVAKDSRTWDYHRGASQHCGKLRSHRRSLSDETKKILASRFKGKAAAKRRAYRQRWREALYGRGHPYARPGLHPDSLDEIDSGEIEDFTEEHVVPRNSVLVAAGQFDPDLLTEHVAFRCGEVDPGKPARVILEPARSATPTWIAGDAGMPTAVVDFEVGFAGRPGLDDSYATRLVLSGILRSKLARLRESRGLSYGFSASYVPQRSVGYWFIGGSADPARAVEAAKVLMELLGEVRAGRDSFRNEFVLARRDVLAGLLASAHDAPTVADRLALMARFGLKDDFFDTLARNVASLTLEEVEALAVRELSIDQQVLGVFGSGALSKRVIEAAKSTAD